MSGPQGYVQIFTNMNFNGIIIGAAVFLSIGICHLLVIRMEYHWGIHEMFLQEKRVLRGWFPENPKRQEYYRKRRKEMEGRL